MYSVPLEINVEVCPGAWEVREENYNSVIKNRGDLAGLRGFVPPATKEEKEWLLKKF